MSVVLVGSCISEAYESDLILALLRLFPDLLLVRRSHLSLFFPLHPGFAQPALFRACADSVRRVADDGVEEALAFEHVVRAVHAEDLGLLEAVLHEVRKDVHMLDRLGW